MTMVQSETILNKLKTALDADGDFPTRARVISELQRLTEDPKTPVNKVVETVLREPSLATRILHLVNSVMYARAAQITNLSQAVVHLGLKSIYNLCANFVLMQRFTPLAKKGSSFFDCFMLSLLSANIASLLDKGDSNEGTNEEGYLSGSLFTIGPLLLGYYFPKLFEDAEKRAERRKIDLFKSVGELLGVPAVCVSLGVVDSLSVPEKYKNILSDSLLIYSRSEDRDFSSYSSSSIAVAFATEIAEAIITSKDANVLKESILAITKFYNADFDKVLDDLKKVPTMIKGQSEILEISSDALPGPFLDLLEGRFSKENDESQVEDSRVAPYIEQLEVAIKESETLPSMVATVMEALLFALDFERVIYLERDLNGSLLKAKLALGDNPGSYTEINVNLESSSSKGIVEKAFKSGGLACSGLPLYSDAWPCIAVPVGFEDRSMGVIYADKKDDGSTDTLPEDITLSCSLLADILDRGIIKNRDS